eukprot:gnl/TRDRNA2_/TRDRNA2_198946_c0_seq1.p1 gnl/TRDRNA2_/TRDRNA2_198946_c0~~gnl/TRDRNA2_/TRDRNA2_198946_c0_seq1.p1  ORF type:complete len:282 (+),score=37.94 gnl/TRDRNA2_/TRDRNA2_198946_c0_seq1:157-1002(+)
MGGAFAGAREGPHVQAIAGHKLVVCSPLSLHAAPEVAYGLAWVLLRRCRVKKWSFDAIWDESAQVFTSVLKDERLLTSGGLPLTAYERFFRSRVRPLLACLVPDWELAERAKQGTSREPFLTGDQPDAAKTISDWRVHAKLMIRWKSIGESYAVAPSWHQDFKGGPTVSVLWYFIQPTDAVGSLDFTVTTDAQEPPVKDAAPNLVVPLDDPKIVAFRRGPPSPARSDASSTETTMQLALWHRTGNFHEVSGTAAGACNPCVDAGAVRGILSFVIWLPGDHG